MVALVGYILLGVSVLSGYENWSFVTCFYVIIQIVTTVGYGDIPPHGSGMVFLTIYVLIGTVLVASIVTGLAASFLDASESRLRQSLSLVKTTLVNSDNSDDGLCSVDSSVSSSQLGQSIAIYLFFLAIWVVYFAYFEGCTCSYGATLIEGCKEDACIASGGTQLSVEQALYMGVITFSTVGFGDYTPKSRMGRRQSALRHVTWDVMGPDRCE